jgi:hypothetical protein
MFPPTVRKSKNVWHFYDLKKKRDICRPDINLPWRWDTAVTHKTGNTAAKLRWIGFLRNVNGSRTSPVLNLVAVLGGWLDLRRGRLFLEKILRSTLTRKLGCARSGLGHLEERKFSVPARNGTTFHQSSDLESRVYRDSKIPDTIYSRIRDL